MGKLRESTYLFQCAGNIIDNSASILNSFANSSFLITGSTGLIGSQLTRTLILASEELSLNLNIVLPVRNTGKAIKLFTHTSYNHTRISIISWTLASPLPEDNEVDYIIHAACSTSSKEFVNSPIDTIINIIKGTQTLLDYATKNNVKRFLYLSTMEVYGEVSGLVSETNLGCLDPMIVRNSYPEAKRLSECLVASYASQLNLSSSTIRLAQTFGEGVSYFDSRVFAEFGRCAREKKDIVLLTNGLSKNVYISIDDTIRALLYILLYGKSGEAYNAANPDTYCSILQMAHMVNTLFNNESSKIRFEEDPERSVTFRKSTDLNMDCSKLKSLGWEPLDSLENMYKTMLNSWKG